MTSVPLTRRQREIIDFLRDYTAEHQISPTLEEIAGHLGVNKVTVFGHVSELERKGVIVRAARGISRGLRLAEDEGLSGSPTVPILGTVAAGSPIEALETPEQLDLGSLLPRDKEVYALRVRGDSMIEDAICDGDIVLIESRDHANDGETVVALIDGEETTLKRYYREKNRIRLQPANSAMRPIYTDRLTIRGVLIGVVRQV